jgi:hypothetical protein
MLTTTSAENVSTTSRSLAGVASLTAPSARKDFSTLAAGAQYVMSLELPSGPLNDGLPVPVLMSRKLVESTRVSAICRAVGLSCATTGKSRHARAKEAQNQCKTRTVRELAIACNVFPVIGARIFTWLKHVCGHLFESFSYRYVFT